MLLIGSQPATVTRAAAALLLACAALFVCGGAPSTAQAAPGAASREHGAARVGASGGSSGAVVAQPLGGSFSISPARRYVTARPPAQLGATHVANTTSQTLRVRVLPVLLGQLPAGAFTFELTGDALTQARDVLAAQPASFVLGPGASREVQLRWRGLPRGAKLASAGVVYQAVPVSATGPVQVVEQLLGVDLLSLPGRHRSRGALQGLAVSQQAPHVLDFALQTRNTGQAIAAPSRLVLTVHERRSGRRLLTRTLPGDIVLPGAEREFMLQLAHRLPAGAYTAYAHVAFGASHRLQAQTSFVLAAPNELTCAHLQLGPLLARGTSGAAAQVAAAARNTGTAPGSTALTLSLYRLYDGVAAAQPLATRHLRTPRLAAGAHSELSWALGRLKRGTYRLLASYATPDGTSQTLVADFHTRQALGLLVRLRGFSREHALLIPGLLIALAGALLVGMLLRQRRLSQALRVTRAQLAALRVPGAG